jgi:hypothetical protein
VPRVGCNGTTASPGAYLEKTLYHLFRFGRVSSPGTLLVRQLSRYVLPGALLAGLPVSFLIIRSALQVLRSGFATPGFQVLLVTADPYGCPFFPTFRRDFPGRSVLQALVTFPGGSVTSFS